MPKSYHLTKTDRLLQILSDGGWHSTRELARRIGHTFGTHKSILVNRDHYTIEKRHHPRRRYQYQYRLVLS